jgi:hypothetical protein
MKPCRWVRTYVHVGVAVILAASVSAAQEVTYLGTVTDVDASRLLVTVIDEASKREELLPFAIDRDTKFKRGDRILSFADARIAKGERVAVRVDPAAKTRMLAIEIRLGAAPAATTRSANPSAAGSAAGHAGHQAAPQSGAPAMQMPMQSAGWQLMQDGVVFGLFNRQGGPRGGDEFVVPNWWMGMWLRQRGDQQVGLTAMLSLDAATVGKSGYREIFQVGEALDGKPLIDRQHPHDLFMQLSASWRVPLSDRTSLVFAGGPAGEPTLGPVAFMHRASATGLVLAPLGHHTFDSTHISFGVVSAALERGRWTFEGSIFNGREPDEHRWDFDFGAMDSAAARVWFKPTDSWELQVSSGRLREPEELVEGDATRTTASASWTEAGDARLSAVTAGYGVNTAHGERRHGLFGEFTVERGANAIFGRAEFQQVETHVLLTGEIPEEDHGEEAPSTVAAFTIGAARRLVTWRGFEGAIGAQATFYGVPDILRSTHGERPVSFQAFLSVRLPAGRMGRMRNMRMSQGHKMAMDHSGHVMR